MVIMDRDLLVLREVSKWRFCLGRHIKVLANFSGVRACDRRLKILIESGYLERQKVLYGVPSLYTLTSKGKSLIGTSKYREKIRVEQIVHDIAVIDSAIYFMNKYNLKSSEITSEKELHKKSGFGNREHVPDFIFMVFDEKYAIEIEFALKSKDRLTKNIESNFLNYDKQVWVIYESNSKLYNILNSYINKYPNTEILFWESVKNG